MDWLLLALAVCLSSGRSVFSKKIRVREDDWSGFYLSQAILFSAAGAMVFVCNPAAVMHISITTVWLALIYGALLIASQWCYTIALQDGPTSICAMLYSFGFIFPALSGVLFWKEPFTVSSGFGLLLTVLAIVVSAFPKSTAAHTSRNYILPILVAMTASGGLGILQKIQQTSSVAFEQDAFLVLAFTDAAIVSCLAVWINKRAFSIVTEKTKGIRFPLLAGICFGAANRLNTSLAGRIDSAILFPVQNIGVMIVCATFGIIFFHERMTKSQVLAMALGMLAILVLGIS